MSESQGNYDLALSRKDHDMFFPIISSDQDTAFTIWDLLETNWDLRETTWDLHTIQTNRVYSILPINGADKVAQQIKITLLAFLGEWFLDVTFGMPYLEEILVKNPHMPSVETIIRAHINNVPHVIRIESFAMQFNNTARMLYVDFTAHTDYGPVKDSVKLNTVTNV